jgi:hypothetical protein
VLSYDVEDLLARKRELGDINGFLVLIPTFTLKKFREKGKS